MCLPSASTHGAMQLEGLYQMESWFVLARLQESEKETILLYEPISLQYSVTVSRNGPPGTRGRYGYLPGLALICDTLLVLSLRHQNLPRLVSLFLHPTYTFLTQLKLTGFKEQTNYPIGAKWEGSSSQSSGCHGHQGHFCHGRYPPIGSDLGQLQPPFFCSWDGKEARAGPAASDTCFSYASAIPRLSICPRERHGCLFRTALYITAPNRKQRTGHVRGTSGTHTAPWRTRKRIHSDKPALWQFCARQIQQVSLGVTAWKRQDLLMASNAPDLGPRVVPANYIRFFY